MKIYVINLKSSQDRKRAMEQQISKIKQGGFVGEFLFFNAIEAKENEHLKLSKHYNSVLTKLYRGRDMSPGQIACFASHFLLWQKCIELNEPIVILEDDVELLANFARGVENIRHSKHEYVRMGESNM